MKRARRRFLHLAATVAALPALSRFAWAQSYPSRPVRIVVGFSAGGIADVFARLIGQWLSERMGQQFVVENRTGAGSSRAVEAVAKSRSDGYTLVAIGSPNVINATLYKNLNFNLVRDIAPVASLYRKFPDGSVGESIVSSQNVARIYRLCEGQSGQDQHGAQRGR